MLFYLFLCRRTETFLKMLPEVDSVLVQKVALNNKPFDGLGKLLGGVHFIKST